MKSTLIILSLITIGFKAIAMNGAAAAAASPARSASASSSAQILRPTQNPALNRLVAKIDESSLGRDISIDHLESLIRSIPNLNESTSATRTPLVAAIMAKKPDVVRLLIRSGALVNARADRDTWTPLFWAIFTGITDSVNELIQAGADVNLCKTEGVSPLMWAACNGELAAVKALLHAGARIDLKDNAGKTARQYAELNITEKRLFPGHIIAAIDDAERELSEIEPAAQRILSIPDLYPYEILGVGGTASQDEINKAYRELTKKWHPDRPQYAASPAQKQLAQKVFIHITCAYETLTKK